MHNDERVFWRTMTPARCGALYKRYFALFYPQKQTQEKGGSLSEYLMGGGE